MGFINLQDEGYEEDQQEDSEAISGEVEKDPK
jgi:hypothetical protein